MKVLLGRMYADKGRMEEILTATDLSWEMVRPGTLSNAAGVGTTSGVPTFEKGMEVPKISRKDLATFLVDEAERRRYLRRFVVPVPRA